MGMGMDTAGNKRQQHWSVGGMDTLPDDILINILSRLDIKEASRMDDNQINATEAKDEFKPCVNTVLEAHQGPKVEGLVISFCGSRIFNIRRKEKELALVKMGRPCLERVAIDTKSDYYDSPQLKILLAFIRVGALTRDEAKLAIKIPQANQVH